MARIVDFNTDRELMLSRKSTQAQQIFAANVIILHPVSRTVRTQEEDVAACRPHHEGKSLRVILNRCAING
ncbi:MAG: hypothetical protein M3456_12650 [Actinomycetota bacterium]|nr:hypothetical protein [Actinomycetota bacterium]